MHEQQALVLAGLFQKVHPLGLMSGLDGVGMGSAGSEAAEEAGSDCDEQSAEQIRGAWPGTSSSAVREKVATSSAWALLASKVLSEIYVDYAEMYQDSY